MKRYLVFTFALLTLMTQAQSMRAIGLDFPQMSLDTLALANYTQELCRTGFNSVGITAGRLDWTYFRWQDHSENWSNELAQDRDLVADTLEVLKQCDTIRHRSLIVDVFAPRYIEMHPEAATFTYKGERLPYQVSSLELARGDFGKRLLAMLEYLALHFEVESISLTELFYYEEGYSEAERKDYMDFSGHMDWPRTATGEIDIDDLSIGVWRSSLVKHFIAKAAQVVQKHGKQLLVDVRVSWDDLVTQSRQFGQDYSLLLEHADGLVLWVYLGLTIEGPDQLTTLFKAYKSFSDRLVFSVGLWDNQGPSLDPGVLKRTLELAETLELNVWITPSSLMNQKHMEVLKDVW